MPDTVEERRAKRRAYYLKNKKKLNAINMAWARKNPDRVREASKKYYHKHKAKLLKKMSKYWKAHQKKIAEQARVRRWKNMGLVAPARNYSFYNDFIIPLQRLGDSGEAVWKILGYKIGLTKKQRFLVKLAKKGMTQMEQAAHLGVVQATIAKTWGGTHNTDYGSRRIYGGIYKKVLTMPYMELTQLLQQYPTLQLELKKEIIPDVPNQEQQTQKAL